MDIAAAVLDPIMEEAFAEGPITDLTIIITTVAEGRTIITTAGGVIILRPQMEVVALDRKNNKMSKNQFYCKFVVLRNQIIQIFQQVWHD